ncbi:hypothetical protein BJ138DRAFT_1011688 [Hygrophoropsis aurantiaca]|uniref:Uncharacterized protein n=1 Tax=Hygrophoropsis aurantiaca TaxID=72124 RepID=A0ACB8A7M2_9AGAM|nr:hypothetical protein BJ138DRAFT_1011688 [Hygrophoropsis aurantiaca]
MTTLDPSAAAAAAASLLAALEPTLLAVKNSHYLEIASLVLLVYEYVSTLREEIDFFWSGRWTLSRVLFFLVRTPRHLSVGHGLISGLPFTTRCCDHAMRATFTISLLALCVNQAILLLRVWHMFSNSVPARFIATCTFIGCALASLITLALSFDNLHSQALSSFLPPYVPPSSIEGLEAIMVGCTAPPPSDIWKVFVPSIVVHTVLYLFTVATALEDGRWTRRPLMLRLLRDGGSIYFIAMVTVCYSAIGARLTGDPAINLPATYSDLTLVINSIAVSRLMFSIESLAGKLGTNVRCLLNPAELSRVNWRFAAGGEIVVEMETYEPRISKAPPIL